MEADAEMTRSSDGHGGLGEGQAVEHPSGHSIGQINNDKHAMGDDMSEGGLFVDQDEDIKSEDDIEDEGGPGPQNHDKNAHDSEAEQYSGSGNRNDDEHESRPASPNHDTDSYDSEAERYSDPSEERDDECMIVDEDGVPDDIKAKFSNFTFNAFPDAADGIFCSGLVPVKVEEDEDDGEDDRSVLISDLSDDDPDFFMDEDDILSDGEGPRKRRRQRVKSSDKTEETSIWEESTLRHRQETCTMPTDAELAELYSQHEELSLLKKQGPLTLRQRVTLGRLTGRIDAIEKMAAQEPPVEGQSAAVNLAGDTAITAEHDHDQPAAEPSKKNPRPAAKTAKEYWERAYREEGLSIRNAAENLNKRKRMPVKSNKSGNDKTSDATAAKLMRMLQNSNPIVARAARGAVAMPGPIQATRQKDQVKAMKEFYSKIMGNPKSRSKSDDEKRLVEAFRSFGMNKVRAFNGRWKLSTGMKSALYNHQLVGTSWMLRQEFSPDGPHGGILADQMGLGKTVQVLAAMSVNRPSQEDKIAGRHQTLIVAPAIAIGQWEREIRKHCHPSFVKVIHHYRASNKVEPDLWKKANIMYVLKVSIAHSKWHVD